MSISKKTRDLNVSGIRKVFDLASRLKDPINLSIGQPDFDVFDSVKETAIDCIKKGLNK
ncbi:MAG: Aspartate aminotransferase, partial [uncultured bacterium]